jgi:hypothetical protein
MAQGIVIEMWFLGPHVSIHSCLREALDYQLIASKTATMHNLFFHTGEFPPMNRTPARCDSARKGAGADPSIQQGLLRDNLANGAYHRSIDYLLMANITACVAKWQLHTTVQHSKTSIAST